MSTNSKSRDYDWVGTIILMICLYFGAKFVWQLFDSEPVYQRENPSWSGDIDCVDIGKEIWVGSDDPNGLDADGDGWGCEGW